MQGGGGSRMREVGTMEVGVECKGRKGGLTSGESSLKKF